MMNFKSLNYRLTVFLFELTLLAGAAMYSLESKAALETFSRMGQLLTFGQ